ncbi:hypothetical protein V5799_016825 [Amblyomma americanum]|uniref:WAP domain-containing protein n=2 Tax=Amblyomma americanum TaxID=6943 RepID=A0AAQ4F425_AMBAM
MDDLSRHPAYSECGSQKPYKRSLSRCVSNCLRRAIQQESLQTKETTQNMGLALVFVIAVSATLTLAQSGRAVDLECVQRFRVCEQECVAEAETSKQMARCTRDCERKHNCNQPSCPQDYDESKCLLQTPFLKTCYVDAMCPEGSRCCATGDEACGWRCTRLY